MSEIQADQTNANRDTLYVAGTIGTLGIAAVFGVATIISEHNGVDHYKHESTAKTESLAAAQANSFTAALYDRAQYPQGVTMPVLNGEIRTTVTTKSGTQQGVYKDPILLATADIDAKPDTKGEFLNGAWIGIQGNDQNGNVVIKAVRYDSANDTFKPYTAKPTDIVFPNLGVYASQDQASNGNDGLIGFDELGNNALTNGNGSLITPGLSTGMK